MFDMRSAQRIAPGVYSYEAKRTTDSMIDDLEGQDPSPALVQLLDAIDPADLTPLAQLRYLALWDRVESWVAARKMPAIVAVAGVAPRQRDDWAREEVAACLRLSPTTARDRIAVAREVCNRLSTTLARLATGRISVWQVLFLAESVARLDDKAALAVETRVLPRAEKQTITQFRAAVRRAVISVDPRSAHERSVDAADNRSVQLVPGADDTASIIATMPATDAALVHLACDTLARELRETNDSRTLAQRCSDALAEMARRYLAGTLSTAQGRPIALDITIDWATLAGLNDEPAQLGGYGPITAQLARDLAADASWRRILTDPVTGTVLECGPRHDPSPSLADVVVRRFETCTAPGCDRRAVRCDLDHTVRHPLGPTCECNLAPLCRRHHRMKHKAGWFLEHLPDHTMRWTTPLGLVYDISPPAVGPPMPPDPDYEPPVLSRECSHVPAATGSHDRSTSLSLGTTSTSISIAASTPIAHLDDDPPF